MTQRDAAQRRVAARHGASQIMSDNNSQVPDSGAHFDIADISQTPRPIAQSIHGNNHSPSSYHEENHEYDEPPPPTLVKDHQNYAPSHVCNEELQHHPEEAINSSAIYEIDVENDANEFVLREEQGGHVFSNASPSVRQTDDDILIAHWQPQTG